MVLFLYCCYVNIRRCYIKVNTWLGGTDFFSGAIQLLQTKRTHGDKVNDHWSNSYIGKSVLKCDGSMAFMFDS